MENVAYPQLMFVHGEKYENQVFSNVVSETATSFTRTIPEFTIGAPVLKPTNHPDWLVLVSSIQLRLWNPVSLQSIDLPRFSELKSAECISDLFLTKAPDHPGSSILVWLKDPCSILFCHVSGDDDQTWTHYLMENYVEELRQGEYFRRPVACDDDTIFMFSSINDSMFKIETINPLLIRPFKSDIPYPYHLVGPCRFSGRYVLACCGDIYVIDLTFGRARNEIDGVRVLKFDFSSMSWNIVDSCPNKAFFISDDQAIACPITSDDSSQVGNRVYFTGFFDNAHTQFLYTYHIAQKKIKVSLLATPENVSQPYWIREVVAHEVLEKTMENYYHSDENFVKRRDEEMLMSDINYYDGNDEMLLSDLPIDILRMISSHLKNPLDYFSFRSTSKFFLSMGSAKEWRNILRHSEEKSDNDPWLIAPFLFHKGMYSMVDPFSRNKYYTSMPEDLDKYSYMCYSSHGKIIMSNQVFDEELGNCRSKMRLYNPLTKKIVTLPTSPFMLERFFIKADSVIVGVTLDFFKEFYYIATEESKRDMEWHGGPLRDESGEFKLDGGQSNFNFVCLGDLYYLLVNDGNLMYFSKEENCLKTHCLKEPCASDSLEKIYLVECDGDLLSINVGIGWKWVRVFKFNQSELHWEEVTDLKNNNIYVSTITSIVTKAKSLNAGNKIYFPLFCKNSIIYYSLNTKKFHICDGRDSVMDNQFRPEERLYSCWFRPTFN